MIRLDHVGVAVRSIERAARFYVEGLGLVLDRVETVEDQGVRVGFLSVGDTDVELLEPTSEHGPVARFLEKHGEGIHHVCLEVPDVAAAMERLRQHGARLLSDRLSPGAGGRLVAFVHPRSANGVLVELSQKPGS